MMGGVWDGDCGVGWIWVCIFWTERRWWKVFVFIDTVDACVELIRLSVMIQAIPQTTFGFSFYSSLIMFQRRAWFLPTAWMYPFFCLA